MDLNRLNNRHQPEGRRDPGARLGEGAGRRLALSYQLKAYPRRRYTHMGMVGNRPHQPLEGKSVRHLLAVLIRDSRDLLAITEGRGPAYEEAERCARAASNLIRLAPVGTPVQSHRCLAAAATVLEWGRAALPE